LGKNPLARSKLVFIFDQDCLRVSGTLIPEGLVCGDLCLDGFTPLVQGLPHDQLLDQVIE
jgi:hypothetical protein